MSDGHEVVGMAATGNEACALVQETEPDIVFLDVSLAGSSSGIDVASIIAEQSDAYVVFTTANRRRLPPDLCGAIGVVEKPFTRTGLAAALRFMAARIRKTHNSLGAPDSLQLSPAYSARWQQRSA